MTKIENIRKWVKNKAGVSPIIAIILMVAITVVLAATIYVWVSGFGTHSKGPEEASATCQLVGETTLKFTLTKAPAGTNYSSNEYLIEVVNANNPSERVSTGRVVDNNWTTAGDTYISGPEGSYWDTGETIYITLPDSVKGDTVSYTVEVAGTTIASGDMYIP